MPHRHRALLRTEQRLLAWALAGLLLLAQGLGLAHRVLHAPGLATPTAAWVDGHKAGSSDCVLVDLATQADTLCGPLFGTAAAPAPVLPLQAAPVAAATLAWAGAYLARAPPALNPAHG